MFGENTELMVKMRTAQLREDTERARLVHIAREGKRSEATLVDKMRRTMTLPGLVVRWWGKQTQPQSLDESLDRTLLEEPVSTRV